MSVYDALQAIFKNYFYCRNFYTGLVMFHIISHVIMSHRRVVNLTILLAVDPFEYDSGFSFLLNDKR